jgi:putative DNA primase/helicase
MKSVTKEHSGETSAVEIPLARYTEQSNALSLVHLHGDKFRWHYERGKFFVYDRPTGCWVEDSTGQVSRWAKQVAAKLWENIDGRDATKHATISESARGISAVMKLAQTEPFITVLAAQMDSCVFYFNCANGVLDLRTVKLLPHSPGLLLTKHSPAAFEPDAKCPTFETFLNRIMAGNVKMIGYLQRIFGLCLSGDISVQELYVFYGQGANGKSVLCDLFLALMAGYAGLAPPSLLTNKIGSGEHPTEIADCDGKRLIIGSETEEGATLKIQLVKRLTGDAALKGRYMRQDYFEFPRTFKMILATNNRPRITENTNAIWRRLRLIPFNVVIPLAEQDPKLLDKLKAEWPGVLAWAVRGFIDWQQNGMQTPDEVKVATADYQKEQDVLSDYLAARCAHPAVDEVKVTRTELFSDYQSWANQSGERHPLERNAFFERVRRLNGVSEKQWKPIGQKVPVRGFRGIGLLHLNPGGNNDVGE